jgi:ribosome-associated protein
MVDQNYEIAHKLVNALEEKKGENIVLMDIQEVASFADYFIVCSGTSDRMLRSLADAISETAHKSGGLHAKLEGSAENGWIVVDCGDVVIHLFSPSRREYYRLEELWDKGKVLLRVQ